MAWGALIGAAGGILGNVIGGSMQQSGANQQNQANIAAAREQMAFQERMSNTAYQRSMADMRAAGLNPILAYQKGGASTPGGAMPNLQNEMGGWGPALSGAAHTAAGAAKNYEETRNTREDTSKKATEQDLLRASETKTKMDTLTSAAQAANYSAATDNTRQDTINKAVNYEILKHDVTSAAGQARIRSAEAKAAEDWGPGQLGQQGRTIEAVINRLGQSIGLGGGGTSPTTTPTVPSPKNDSRPGPAPGTPGRAFRDWLERK